MSETPEQRQALHDMLLEMLEQARIPEDDESTQEVYARRPRCPACESIYLKTLGSTRQEGGTTRKWKRCQNCGNHFFVIWE